MKNKLNLEDGPIDFDNIMNNIENLPNKEELIKILQNHAYNMNAINTAHQEKMKAINQKFEEEKKMCENSYNQNMLKILKLFIEKIMILKS